MVTTNRLQDLEFAPAALVRHDRPQVPVTDWTDRSTGDFMTAFRSFKRASTLRLFAILALLAICSGTSASAAGRGTLGETSRASVGISISISPQINFVTSNVHVAALTVGAVANEVGGHLCLQTNMPEGRFNVTVKSIDPVSHAERMSSAVADDARASGICAVKSSNQEGAAVALAVPQEASARGAPVELMISPD